MFTLKRILSRQSPLTLLFVTASAIFTVEIAIMFLLPLIHLMSPLAEALLDAALLVAVLFPALYLSLFRLMARRIVERKQAEAALREARDRLELRVQERTAELHQANETLKASVTQLEQRNRETALLAELGDLLQACTTADEACRAIGHTAPQLFPNTSGVLYAYSPSRDDLEAIVTWGSAPVEPGTRMFEPDKCWALRRGRPHRMDGLCVGLPCQATPSPASALCVPMIAQGETLGVFYLRGDMAVETRLETLALSEQLAITSAEHIALALGNLRLRETLRYQSIRDPLTGLFNRRFMEETLAREIPRAERSQRPIGVLMLDLDHFKRFNDTFGHEAGDTLLRKLGAFLQTKIRGGDVACRFGGEEFVIILPETTLEDAYQRAEQLRQNGRELTVAHRGQSLGMVTLSLGVAIFPQHGTDGDTLLRVADQALYRAKAEGRDRVAVGTTTEE